MCIQKNHEKPILEVFEKYNLYQRVTFQTFPFQEFTFQTILAQILSLFTDSQLILSLFSVYLK